jgi:Tfp pilus assembly protein PilZ
MDYVTSLLYLGPLTTLVLTSLKRPCGKTHTKDEQVFLILSILNLTPTVYKLIWIKLERKNRRYVGVGK